MNESSPSTALEAFRIFIEFLSSNSKTIVILVLLFICRNAISSFVSRLTSLKYKSGESELGMEAAAPTQDKEKIDLRTTDDKPSSEDKDAEIEKNEGDWFLAMEKAFSCSGQVKLATVLESFQYKRSDSFGVNPPLY